MKIRVYTTEEFVCVDISKPLELTPKEAMELSEVLRLKAMKILAERRLKEELDRRK